MQPHSAVTFRESISLWLAGTIAGWAFGFSPAMVHMSGAFCCDGDVVETTTALIPFLFIGGVTFAGSFFVSSSQARAMQDILSAHAGQWLWLSTTGQFIGWIFGWILNISVFSEVGLHTTVWPWLHSGTNIGAVVGFTTSLFQLIVLYRLRIAQLWWVGASLVGWICASALYWLVYAAAGGPFQATYIGSPWATSAEAPGALPAMLLAWIVGGLVLSLVTGGGMLALLRSVKARSPE